MTTEIAPNDSTPVLAVPRDDQVRVCFHGEGAAAAVNGLVTNDVASLSPGEGCYAVALTPKGKIVTDLRIFRLEDRVITEAPVAAGPAWLALVRKYVNPRLARSTDDSAETRWIELAGRGAPTVLADAGVAAIPERLYAHHPAVVAGRAVVLARIPDYGIPAFVVAVAPSDRGPVLEALARAGAVTNSAPGLEALRIEAGWPRWGIDMDETMLAQEANMDQLGAISWTKGCYTGQEYVARLHYRGHVNRLLRGVRLDAAAPRGASLVRGGNVVGELRSVADSARLGPVGLALVRREVVPGDRVEVRWDATAAAATQGTVTALPFDH